MKYFRFTLFIFLIFFMFLIVFPGAKGNEKPGDPVAQKGILDLRDWDFSRKGSIGLSGQWKFFWQHHLTPSTQVSPEIQSKASLITVPGTWNGHKPKLKQLPGQGFASFTLQVLLPSDIPHLGLKVLDMATAFEIYVDGKSVFSSGKPGKTKETTIPCYGPGVAEIFSPSRTMDILVHVSNFDHWQGGIWEPILLGPISDLYHLREKRVFIDTFLFGSILIMGIYHLFLFWFRPRERSTLYFGLFCLMIALRTITHGERYILTLIPLSYVPLLTAVYLSFYACVPFFSLYTLSIFPKEISKKVIGWICGTGVLFSLFTIILPVRFFSASMPVFQGLTLVALGYGLGCLVKAFRLNRSDSGIFLSGFFILILTIVNDILYTRQVIYTGHFVSMGLFVFILVQAILISRRFSQAFTTVSQQQQALKAENIQRKKMITKLQESEQKFRITADLLPIPLCEYDLSHRITYANQAAADWFGYKNNRLTSGIYLPDLFLETDHQRLISLMTGFPQEPRPASIEFQLLKKDDTRIWGQITTGPVLKNNCLIGGRICFVDLSERKAAERASLFAAEQEKYALVGQVAGKMAHDFNNILGAIMGNAELSLMDCREEETLASLEIILQQTKRGQILTQNLVAFAKDQEPREERFNLNSKIDLVLGLLKKELSRVQLTKILDPDLPDVFADPGMIEQALVNIIQNSIHAMSLEFYPKLIIKTTRKSGKVLIEIRDNGCGIPEKHQKDIYTPSFTLKGSKDEAGAYKADIKGTGYGMANVKKCLEKNRGEVSFKSNLGIETIFTLSLPGVESGCSDEQKMAPPERLSFSGKKILVVEDELSIASVWKNILTHPPFSNQITLAEDAKTAISLFDTHSFDLISLDHMLPGTLNGLNVYAHIRKQNKSIPIIFVSGNIEFIESIGGLKEKDKFLDHLSKPCEMFKYIETLGKWLK
jgi:PAS domain S-box-containing protein